MYEGKKVLIIEDNIQMANLVKMYLENEGFIVILKTDGKSGLEAARDEDINIILLDLMLPRMSGEDVAITLRNEQINTPIIMLTAKDAEGDILNGLELGADDYMLKPFSPKELVVRIKSTFRRIDYESAAKSSEEIEKDDGDLSYLGVEIDLNLKIARYKEKEIKLTSIEYTILQKIIVSNGAVVTNDMLIDELYDENYEAKTSYNSLRVHLSNLRKKIDVLTNNEITVKTIYSLGYKLTQSQLI